MKRIILLEMKRNVNRLSIVCLSVFILLAVVILQIGIKKHETELKQHTDFKKIEQRKADRYINYMQYGLYGFRVLLKSNPIVAIFYNNTTFDDLTAFIDSGVRLKLSEPKIGENIFDRPTGGSLDFSWYLLIIGSMLVLPWSYFAYRNREYIRYLMNFATAKKVYAGVFLGRVILIFISLLLTLGTACIQFLINGITLTASEISGLLIFLLLTLIVLVSLLISGAFFGTIKNTVTGGIIAVFFWVTVVLLWPEILNSIFAGKADENMKPRYLHEFQKVDTLMGFEKVALENTGRYKTIPEKVESDRKMGEHWWNSEFKEIENLEVEMIEKTSENARKFHFWSIINPITFYKSVNNELSSKGYNAYLFFYRSCQKHQKGFLRYYLDKRFYENYSKVVPYLSSGENILNSEVSLPAYFGAGLGVNFFIIIAAFVFTYWRFTRWVFPLTRKAASYKDLHIHLRTGKHITINTRSTDVIHQFLNVFFNPAKKDGRRPFNLTISPSSTGSAKFFYMPDPGVMPGDLKVRTFVSFISRALGLSKEKEHQLKTQAGNDGILGKRFKSLEDTEKVDLMFIAAQLSSRKIFILNDVITRLSDAGMSLYIKRLKSLKADDILVIDIISLPGLNTDSDYHVSVFYQGGKYCLKTIKNYDDHDQ